MYSLMSMRTMRSRRRTEPGQRAPVSVLPTPVGPRKMNEPMAVRLLQTAARTPHGIGDRFEGLLLPDHPLLQPLFHLDQLLPLALNMARPDAGPGGHDFRDVLLVTSWVSSAGPPACRAGPSPWRRASSAAPAGVRTGFGRQVQIIAALSLFQLQLRLLNLAVTMLTALMEPSRSATAP